MKSNEKLTVAIPTRNRLIPLLNLIYSLTLQTYNNFGLVISDDGGIFDIRKYINKYFPGLRFRYLKGPGVNLPLNRDFILQNTDSEYILMCDDDHFLDKNCVGRLYETISGDSRIGIVSAVWPHPDGPEIDYGRVDKKSEHYRLDLDGLNYSSRYNWGRGLGVFYSYHKKRLLIESQFCGGGCLVYRRKAVTDAGGFPKCYTVASFREDTDMSHRVWLSGYRVIINTGALAFHYAAGSGGVRDNKGEFDKLLEYDGKIFLKRLDSWKKGERFGAEKKLNVKSNVKPVKVFELIRALRKNDIESAYVFSENLRIDKKIKNELDTVYNYLLNNWSPCLRFLYGIDRRRDFKGEVREFFSYVKSYMETFENSDLLFGLSLYLAKNDTEIDKDRYYKYAFLSADKLSRYMDNVTLYNLASLAKKNGCLQIAERLFMKLLGRKNKKGFESAYYHLADICFLNKRYEKAEKYLKNLFFLVQRHKAGKILENKLKKFLN